MFLTVGQALVNKTLLTSIESWVYASRCLETALLFHTVWHAVFAWLAPTERDAVKVLQRYYFCKVPAAEA